MKKKKTQTKERIIYIDFSLIRSHYASELHVKGNFTESQIEDMKNHIGRDFIIGSANMSFNLNLFDAIIINEQRSIDEETHDNGIVISEDILERLRHAGESAIEEKENK